MGFWHGRRVLITGHTGFKGGWLSEMLLARRARVAGLALAPDTKPALFDQLELAQRVDHAVCDIRDPESVAVRVRATQPDVVFHLAAQSLVRRSYREPVGTWSTNVMGTAHVLEAVRHLQTPCAVVVVTTDKVYENREWEHPYRECDPLGGHDPYSASKAGTELIAESWRKSFFTGGVVRLATARAGNVIGGGDWCEDRIFPDLARAFAGNRPLAVRNRHAVRPWQHVLDPLQGYLMLAERLADPDGTRYEGAFNFGPEPADQRSVEELIDTARRHWPGSWKDESDPLAPHEAGRLALSIERARLLLRWRPKWDFARAVEETVRWYRDVAAGADAATLVRAQIADFDRQT
jgi:CDP-glucose 4,6-dehydratase